MKVLDLGLDFAAPTSKGHSAAHRHMGSCRPERLWLWPWARECLAHAGRPCRGVNPPRVSPVPSVLPSACELALPEAVTSTGSRAPAQLWRLRGQARPGAGCRADARAGRSRVGVLCPSWGTSHCLRIRSSISKPRTSCLCRRCQACCAGPQPVVGPVQPQWPAPACCSQSGRCVGCPACRRQPRLLGPPGPLPVPQGPRSEQTLCSEKPWCEPGGV